MSSRRECLVAIYTSEYKHLCAWVLKNQTLETGGDLFGLWKNDHTAVIQLVLGPGKHCRRTSGSFYQDVEYLEKVGSHLTGKEGLCHIGEWHSHHTIGLKRPSGGDERTVWTNMPKYGLSRFLLFIANIENHRDSSASVGCFLFEFKKNTNNRELRPGKFILLQNESPFRSKCLEVLKENAECLNEEYEVRSLEVAKNAISMPNKRPVVGVKVRQLLDEEQGVDNEEEAISIPNERLALVVGVKERHSLDEEQGGRNEEEYDEDFTVAIYGSEYKQICAWVFKNQDLETGGDLFGLWHDDHTAVIQFVLGPGKNCQRTTTSFFQDVEYLEKVGSHLTGKDGLCHIGEWHSHHKIGLKEPSSGDERTVWTNMPKYGLSRFVLFIANFETHKSAYDSVGVGCFLFEGSETSHRRLLPGRFKLLPTESPFRSTFARNSNLMEGAEGLNEDNEIKSLDEVVTGSRDMQNDRERPLMIHDELGSGLPSSTCCSMM
ncbi:uncharacterized protein LOC111328103 [Stylophora pistillata]|uniref:uncharacterized protein LOC111328103 n=1 Tax=Stylophora pistillata TaxID=50429 RepID=UPI000C03F106|nr:uncharacterized protein LOC111328103 [Stylophora pistillata]